MDNKDKIQRIHDLLPKHLNSKTNTNWKGLIAAIGAVDQDTANLVTEVRQQLFVKTASRPYLDRLAANSKIARPKLVGMDDTSFRDYIPVLSYKPKQVKLIVDKLLDIFFFKESTTAFITSQAQAPFNLENNWEFEYVVDETTTERIGFRTSEFTDISNATADEVVAAINRQAKGSYATVYFDSVTKNSYIRMFTNTIGSKGSIRITGGRANAALQFNGFIDNAGNGSNTQWNVTKIGDTVSFQHVGGSSPGLDKLVAGDIAIVNLSGNVGSFEIKELDLANNRFTFKNLFGTPGVITQTNGRQVKFIHSIKYVAYTNPRRAMVWETSPSEIVVEMPTSPPVVKRSLKGSFHMNGLFSQMSNRDSDTSLTLVNANGFPLKGSFYLERVEEIRSRILTTSENEIVSRLINGRLEGKIERYDYADRTVLTTTGDITQDSRQILNLASTTGLTVGDSIFMDGVRQDTTIVSILGNIVNMSDASSLTLTGSAITFGGNTLTGISPQLPQGASLNEVALTSLQRGTANDGVAVSSTPHGYQVDEIVIISGSSGALNPLNGSWKITEITNPTTFKFFSFGPDTSGPIAVAGTARVERISLANSGSKIILTDAVGNLDTRITGSYTWDLTAPFVLSSAQASTAQEINVGRVVRLLETVDNTIPETGGFVIFDYGKNNQEGPVRYLYKPTSNTIAVDPSYVFQKSHDIGCTVTAIRSKGPHPMSTFGNEYPPYITDPSEARIILQELIKSVKSAGIFVNFLVHYPEQLYATLDVYNSGVDPG